ncbi:unnamed protein product [Rhizoctonia solani]|uniref:Uncharacterized protein n=1 Tax=Rhizoctonia solani TaxID=456999 RepID=A0A8H3B5L3_9AGAM|nr:unnamed protein product [Rhizoctonia solani]
MDQRRVLTASEHVDALTRQAHAHFPTSSDGYTLHVTVDDCEAWDNAVMGLENQETVPDEQSEESFEGKMSKSRPDTAKGKKANKVQSSATRSTTADNTGQATRKRKAQRRVLFLPEETRHNVSF